MRNLIRIAAIGAALALLALFVAGGALAKVEIVRLGNLVLRNNSGISPTKLPKRKRSSIKGSFSVSIATADGSHPPPAREVIINIDKNVYVNAKGLPVCKPGQLEARDSKAARRICGKAIVGKGRGHAEIAFPEQKPIIVSSPLTLFNGGVKGGKTMVFVHAFITVPAPAAIVTPVKITRLRHGSYGIYAVAKIPPIAGGAGSVTSFKLTVGRNFAHKGKRTSYLTASCPTGRLLAKGQVLFGDSTRVKLARVLPCTPKG